MNREQRLAMIEPLWHSPRCDWCSAFAETRVERPNFMSRDYCPRHMPSRLAPDAVVTKRPYSSAHLASVQEMTTPEIEPEEIREFLAAIENGQITVTPDRPVEYCGIETFTASNGWHVGVFNDCDEWDYLQWIETADGRQITYEELTFHYPSLADWQPSESDWGGLTP